MYFIKVSLDKEKLGYFQNAAKVRKATNKIAQLKVPVHDKFTKQFLFQISWIRTIGFIIFSKNTNTHTPEFQAVFFQCLNTPGIVTHLRNEQLDIRTTLRKSLRVRDIKTHISSGEATAPRKIWSNIFQGVLFRVSRLLI